MTFSRDNPSPAYTRALAEATTHHATSKTYSGKLMRPHKEALQEIVARHRIASALDYGCGKGAQYAWRDPKDGNRTIEQALGFDVVKYDPAWPPYAAWPGGTYDLVICTHVLATIPLADLRDWVLPLLAKRATRAVYIAEKLGPAGKTAISAPELRPVDWQPRQWLDLLAEAMGPYRTGVYFSARQGTPLGARTRRWYRGRSSASWRLVYDSLPIEDNA